MGYSLISYVFKQMCNDVFMFGNCRIKHSVIKNL